MLVGVAAGARSALDAFAALARVLLGDAYRAKETCSGIRHAPERDMATPGLLYDSVIAEPGCMPGAPGDHQHHTEVVIFNGGQAYPVYLIQIMAN